MANHYPTHLKGSMLLACFPVIGALIILSSAISLLFYTETLYQEFYTTMQQTILQQSIDRHLISVSDEIPTISDCESDPITDGFYLSNESYELEVWVCGEDGRFIFEWWRMTN